MARTRTAADDSTESTARCRTPLSRPASWLPGSEQDGRCGKERERGEDREYRSPARSYPPPLPLAASLRLTSPAPSQVFLFISGVARVPRLRNPRSLLPAMRARCAMQPPRGMPPMQPSKGAISLQHRNPWKSFVTFDTTSFTFHEKLNHFPKQKKTLSKALLTTASYLSLR
ncbi:hypothetical protein K0M31_009457 [Melipona bicolor]|uniref:Uncharacterized protein n=1 Tax=Melipona bicolor TaxID=60889 RepID=A0AA40FNR3_9HYME|nr:hypothetical protein K0M31_009457 [Melipona bicolor]